jgi:small subunit ribosomal protein S7
MSRRHAAEKREILPDPKFGDLTVSKFMNVIMYDGKKSAAEHIVYGALDIIRKKAKLNSDAEVVTFFHEAIEKVRPHVEVRSRRVGGATYQVPVEVRTDRSRALAIRWLIGAARARSEKTMDQKLAEEILLAHTGNGNAAKKKEDTHKMADANKAFAHYRW